MDTIKPGDHGSTYGGNPLGMAVARTAVEVIIEEGMVENSLKMGDLFTNKLNALNSPSVKEIRSRGLFCGMEFKHDLKHDGNDFAKILMKNGLITKATQKHVIRFAPALVIKESEIIEAVEIIDKSLQEFDSMN